MAVVYHLPPPPPSTSLPPAGWYEDGTRQLSWWDGTAWGPFAPLSAAAPRSYVDEGRTLSVLCHLSYFIFSIFFALIVRATEGGQNPYTRHHATEALNFQLTLVIAIIGSWVVAMFGAFLGSFEIVVITLLALGLAIVICGIVFSIVAAVAASRGEWYRYPVSLRMVSGARDA